MVVIGVVSGSAEGRIEKAVKKIFSVDGMRTVILESGKIAQEEIQNLGAAGVGYIIITLKKGEIRPVYLDILILESIADISYELVKCVSAKTRLIYNADSMPLVKFKHPNAISYGMSYTAEATISSVDDKFDGVSFVYCLQRSVTSLGGNILYEGEFTVSFSNIKSGITDILAAITCGMICDIPEFVTIKI